MIDGPALPPQEAVGHPPTPADVLSGNLPEALAQLGLLDIDNLDPMALGAAASPGLRLEHRLLQLGLRQKLLEPGVLLLQLSQSSGFLGLHAAVLLPPTVIRRLRHLDDAADLDDGLALGDQLLSGLELADDLLGCVADAFHGEVPGPVWPVEDSHSPWTNLRGPRQCITFIRGRWIYIKNSHLEAFKPH